MANYRDKLITALKHPLAEVRMRAIITLGWRGEARAALPLLETALVRPVDVVERVAAVESLAQLGEGGRAALASLVERHPAHAVRESARVRLRELDLAASE